MWSFRLEDMPLARNAMNMYHRHTMMSQHSRLSREREWLEFLGTVLKATSSGVFRYSRNPRCTSHIFLFFSHTLLRLSKFARMVVQWPLVLAPLRSRINVIYSIGIVDIPLPIRLEFFVGTLAFEMQLHPVLVGGTVQDHGMVFPSFST